MKMGEDANALKEYKEFFGEQLNVMIELVKRQLDTQQRQLMSSILVIDVYLRDVLQRLVDSGISSVNDFEWKKQLR